jgi:WD40 repeat protein
VVGTFENMHAGAVGCGCVGSDGRTVVLGGVEDCAVSVWTLTRRTRITGGVQWSFKLKARLCGHLTAVTCVGVSVRFNALVSSAEDCTLLLWDLSKMRVVRPLLQCRIPHPASVIQVTPLLPVSRFSWPLSCGCCSAVS